VFPQPPRRDEPVISAGTVEAAVDIDRCAGDVGGLCRTWEADGIGDVPGIPDVAEGDTRHVERSRRGVAGADGSADHSGSDRIHTDACVGQVERGAHRQMVLALGRSVAHRYAKEGHSVALVARRREALRPLAEELSDVGASARPIAADLSRANAVSRLVQEIRGTIGEPDVIYYGPSVGGSSPSPSVLSADDLQPFVQVRLPTLVGLVREFVPPMIEWGGGAVVGGDGSERDAGNAPLQRRRSCPGCPAKLSAVAGDRSRRQGVSTSADSMSARPSSTAFGTPGREAARGGWRNCRNQGPKVAPDHLADLMWDMHHVTKQPEVVYAEGLFDR
jgi:short chain dehydrogenase